MTLLSFLFPAILFFWVLFFPYKLTLLTSSWNLADLRVSAATILLPLLSVSLLPVVLIVTLRNSDTLDIYPMATAAPDLEA